jgi:hypothetical protein
MTGIVNPDTDGAVDFLEHWARGGPWVLSAIEPDGPIETRTFRDRQATKKWIETWQGKRNIYFSVNTPKLDLKKKATKADIGALNALHVDLDTPDGADPEQAKAAIILPRLKSYRLPPSVILDSGGGLQGFWLMREPVALNGPDSIKQLEAYNRQLETDLGGDHCHNVDRIMRLPGTINLPNAVKRAKGRRQYLAAVVEANWQRRYAIEQFETASPSGGKANAKANDHPQDGEERWHPRAPAPMGSRPAEGRWRRRSFAGALLGHQEADRTRSRRRDDRARHPRLSRRHRLEIRRA